MTYNLVYTDFVSWLTAETVVLCGNFVTTVNSHFLPFPYSSSHYSSRITPCLFPFPRDFRGRNGSPDSSFRVHTSTPLYPSCNRWSRVRVVMVRVYRVYELTGTTIVSLWLRVYTNHRFPAAVIFRPPTLIFQITHASLPPVDFWTLTTETQRYTIETYAYTIVG